MDLFIVHNVPQVHWTILILKLTILILKLTNLILKLTNLILKFDFLFKRFLVITTDKTIYFSLTGQDIYGIYWMRDILDILDERYTGYTG